MRWQQWQKTMRAELAKGQIEINKAEAHSQIHLCKRLETLYWLDMRNCSYVGILSLAPVTLFVCAYLNVAIPELPTFDMGIVDDCVNGDARTWWTSQF
jgi:hypothetical protein